MFQGLKISEEKELCKEYMGQFPVISISLKGVEGLNFESAKEGLAYIIGKEAMRFYFLKDSPHLTEEEKGIYQGYIATEKGGLQLALTQKNM